MTDPYHARKISWIPGLPSLSVVSGVLAMSDGKRVVDAQLRLAIRNIGIASDAAIHLDAGAMRALARALDEHADRWAFELLPLTQQPPITDTDGQEAA